MIDAQVRPMVAVERIEPERPPYLEQTRCGRCGNKLTRVYLTVGSWVVQRCHHTIKLPNGERKTCGYENTIRPTR